MTKLNLGADKPHSFAFSTSRRFVAAILLSFLGTAAIAAALSVPLAGTITPIEVYVTQNSTPVAGVEVVVREHPSLDETVLTTDANGICSMNYVNDSGEVTWVEVEAVGISTTPANYELCRHVSCSAAEVFDDLVFELD